MNYLSARMGVGCGPGHLDCNGTFREPLSARSHRLLDRQSQNPTAIPRPHPQLLQPPRFSAAEDEPDRARHVVGAAVLAVGLAGLLGNALATYAVWRSRPPRSAGSALAGNLAAAGLLASLTQPPVFFAAGLHRRWPFGERACQLHAFCGSLLAVCSMTSLTAIAADRCLAVARPLALLGGVTRRRAGALLAGLWAYALGWSLPPFFGWSAYVPEGLRTPCAWDYLSFTPSVRAYTALLFVFVFLVPLGAVAACALACALAVRTARREARELGSGEAQKAYARIQSEWKLARAALLVVLLSVVSWSPYALAALTATAGYPRLLARYTDSLPAVMAQASAVLHPVIYAVAHPKYRAAIARYVPLLRAPGKDLRSSFSSSSSHRPTATCLSSLGAVARANRRRDRMRLSPASDSESCWVESEVAPRRTSVDVFPLVQLAGGARGAPDPAFNAPVSGVTEEDVPDGGVRSDGKAFLLQED
ncbi:melanopsin-like [Conger conger]|uniref:melanopsin-like n=1 Tax=Conger conger TaxID=82655 RepID=UPI002A59D4FF|nr:melanopsin-like [Conger conger]